MQQLSSRADWRIRPWSQRICLQIGDQKFLLSRGEALAMADLLVDQVEQL